MEIWRPRRASWPGPRPGAAFARGLLGPGGSALRSELRNEWAAMAARTLALSGVPVGLLARAARAALDEPPGRLALAPGYRRHPHLAELLAAGSSHAASRAEREAFAALLARVATIAAFTTALGAMTAAERPRARRRDRLRASRGPGPCKNG